MDVLTLALWGLGGAFVYAAPRLIVALSSAPKGPWRPWGEFVVALAIGTIGAASFGEAVGNWIGWKSEADQRALAVVIGLVGNPAAPSVVRLSMDQLLRRLGASPTGGATDKRESPPQ